MKTYNTLRIFVFLGITVPLCALDNPHFYRARLWTIDEPRSAKPGLQTFNAFFSGGDSKTGFNGCGEKVPLFAIFGNENLKDLGVSSPVSDKAFFPGVFSITEIQLHAYSNFDCGFFAHLALPIRKLEVRGTHLESTRICDNSVAWKTTVKKVDAVLKKNHLSAGSVDESGVGDLTLLAGWSYTNYDTYADFLDASIQTGVLFPTGRKKNIHEVFSFPLGYDGHYGVPLIADAALGVLNWLNVGLHAEGLFFFDKTRCVRLRNKASQHGFIRLDKAKVRVHEGTIWDITAYLKADHFTYGFSFLLGYSFDHQNRRRFSELRKGFDKSIVNADPQLQPWSMGTLHAVIDYDWSNEDNPYGPRLGLEYNHVLHGKNVFRTAMTGGWVGLDLEWNY